MGNSEVLILYQNLGKNRWIWLCKASHLIIKKNWIVRNGSTAGNSHCLLLVSRRTLIGSDSYNPDSCCNFLISFDWLVMCHQVVADHINQSSLWWFVLYLSFQVFRSAPIAIVIESIHLPLFIFLLPFPVSHPFWEKKFFI